MFPVMIALGAVIRPIARKIIPPTLVLGADAPRLANLETGDSHVEKSGTMGTAVIEREDADAVTLQFVASRGVLWLGFAVVWSLGWALSAAMGISVIWHQLSDQSLNVLHSVWWLVCWIVAGAAAFRALAWIVSGRPETIIVREGVLILTRGRGRLARADHFPVADIKNVRLLPVLTLQSLAALLGFWGTGRGRVGIDLAGITYRCGSGLKGREAQHVVDELRQRLDLREVSDHPPRTDSTPGIVASRRVIGWVGTCVMLYMFAAGTFFPAGALAMDFSTCTGGVFRPAYRPLDVRSLANAGIISFVPLDDFPLQTVQSLAEHYHTKYQVPVEVRQAVKIPASAYDGARGQLNSSALLAALEEQYPSTSGRNVVVGLTQYDMYIPDVSWLYSFSNRRANRLAVVSTARMDYGCLDFTKAGPEQQLARLRKMVGKNIGVLYFRLAQSRNPGSMLYYDIGGVQELDRMTEEF
jgi:predicted Zn-dependent protease